MPWTRAAYGQDNWSGGFGYYAGASAQDAVDKALVMWLKGALWTTMGSTTFASMHHGGAKGVAAVDATPATGISAAERLELGSRIGYQLASASMIGGRAGWVAPDVCTGELDMLAFWYGAVAAGVDPGGAVAGLPPLGKLGSAARLPATAWGVSAALDALAVHKRFALKDCTAALVGYGNVGGTLHELLERRLRFTMVGDRDTTVLLRQDGFGLRKWCAEGRPMAAFDGVEQAWTDGVTPEQRLDMIVAAPVTILVLAGVEPVITARNAELVQARYVVCPQNLGIADEAYPILHDRGIVVLDELLVSGAGRAASWLEVRRGGNLELSAARGMLQSAMRDAVRATLTAADRWRVPVPEASLLRALARIADDGLLGDVQLPKKYRPIR